LYYNNVLLYTRVESCFRTRTILWCAPEQCFVFDHEQNHTFAQDQCLGCEKEQHSAVNKHDALLSTTSHDLS
jgi:hypothetical protein